MILHDLQEDKFTKLTKALNEVFDIKFNFGMEQSKLVKIQETTNSRIAALRESGVDVSAKDFQKLLLISEGINMVLVDVTQTTQGTKMKIQENQDLDQAEVLLAAKQMADDLQKMAENLASMQVEDLMSITNAMKEEVGTAEAEAFTMSAEAAIGAALDAVKSANSQVTDALLVAQGQQVEDGGSMDTLDTDFGDELGMGDDFADDELEIGDDFEGVDAASGAENPIGREMKEDKYLSAMRMVKEAQQDGKISKDLLKQAFATLRN
jgi:hypothetical protein|tara:strand:+ start:1312 stop:2109 length:798 start_codon:yes stop_codon:yes gene_type:complete